MIHGIIVDNGSRLIVELVVALRDAGASTSIVKVSDLPPVWNPQADFIVLSGSSQNSVQNHSNTIYADEIKFLQNTQLPVLGICLGLELIVSAFGGKLGKLPLKFVGTNQLSMLRQNVLFAGVETPTVYESHRWTVKQTGSELEVIAISDHGIEALKHVSKPIMGVQFHPELSGASGQAILRNFLKMASDTKHPQG